MWSICLRPLLATAGSGAASGGRTVFDPQKAVWQKVRTYVVMSRQATEGVCVTYITSHQQEALST